MASSLPRSVSDRASRPPGEITLEALREGNTLVIAVSDDGRGLNHEAIAAKARKLGLLAPAEEPTVDRLNNLIFHPGFSTRNRRARSPAGASAWTSWRGRSACSRGPIDLQTEPGRGTRLTIRLPARLALETTMIVRIDGQAFAIPVAQIESASALEVEPEDAGPPGEETGNRLSARVRGQKLPVVFAREILGIGESAPARGLSFL